MNKYLGLIALIALAGCSGGGSSPNYILPPVATPTLTPKPTATPVATAKPSPTASPVASVSPSASPVVTISPVASPTSPPPTATLAPTASPSAVATSIPTASPTVAPTSPPTAQPTFAPTNTPTPVPTSPPTVAPTATPQPTTPPTVAPTPTATPVPTPTPVPTFPPTPPGTPNYLPVGPDDTISYEGGTSAFYLDFYQAYTSFGSPSCAGSYGVNYPLVTPLVLTSDLAVGIPGTTQAILSYDVSKNAEGDIIVTELDGTGGTAVCTNFTLMYANVKIGQSWTFKDTVTGVTHTAYVDSVQQTTQLQVNSGIGPNNGVVITAPNVTQVTYDNAETIFWSNGYGPVSIGYGNNSANEFGVKTITAYNVTENSNTSQLRKRIKH